jgi:hypothetical protein
VGKFDRIVAALEALPEARREEIAGLLETLLFGDLNPGAYALNDAQLADLRVRLADPGPFASDEEVSSFFAETEA